MDRAGAAGTALGLLVALALGSAGAASAAQLLYDVDFSSPLHTVGAPPTTGVGPFPRQTVSEIVFEPPEVVASSSGLIDQPLQFQWEAGGGQVDYDQIAFYLGVGASTYEISFDISVDYLGLDGSLPDIFSIFLDTAVDGGTAIRFRANAVGASEGRATMPYPDGGSVYFDFDTPIHVAITVDVLNDVLDVWFDDAQVEHNPTLGLAGYDLSQIRMSLSEIGIYGDARVAVDNLLIYATPEPGTGLLLGFGLIALGWRRRRGALRR